MLWNRRKYDSAPRSWCSHTFYKVSRKVSLTVISLAEIKYFYYILTKSVWALLKIIQILTKDISSICNYYGFFSKYFSFCVSRNDSEMFILYTGRQWHHVFIVREENWEIIIVLKYTNSSGHHFISINAMINFINII